LDADLELYRLLIGFWEGWEGFQLSHLYRVFSTRTRTRGRERRVAAEKDSNPDSQRDPNVLATSNPKMIKCGMCDGTGMLSIFSGETIDCLACHGTGQDVVAEMTAIIRARLAELMEMGGGT
jgi:hypothetical protein